jgi:hypothetical protein
MVNSAEAVVSDFALLQKELARCQASARKLTDRVMATTLLQLAAKFEVEARADIASREAHLREERSILPAPPFQPAMAGGGGGHYPRF